MDGASVKFVNTVDGEEDTTIIADNVLARSRRFSCTDTCIQSPSILTGKRAEPTKSFNFQVG